MADLFDAVYSLRKGCSFSIVDNSLVWDDKRMEAPTVEEIDAEKIKLTNELPMKILRIERNRLLKQSDVYGLQDFPEGEIKEAWKTYRQALRDLPQNQTPALDERNELINVVFPEKPN
jgi:hypothetical protein